MVREGWAFLMSEVPLYLFLVDPFKPLHDCTVRLFDDAGVRALNSSGLRTTGVRGPEISKARKERVCRP